MRVSKKNIFQFAKLVVDLFKHNYNCAVLVIQLIYLNINKIVLFRRFRNFLKLNLKFFFAQHRFIKRIELTQ